MEQLVFLPFLILVASCSALDHSLITVSVLPVSGVQLLTGPAGQYLFEFSEASEVCLFKNLSVATRAQLQVALDHGLEVCRFGWISEQVAAVPRLTSVATCGGGRTGVVTWSASLQRQFGVWCFSQSDSNEAENTTALDAQITTISTRTAPVPQRTTTFTTSTLTFAATTTTTTIPETSLATRNPTTKPLTTTRTVHVTSTIAPWIQTTRKLKTPHSEPFSTQFATISSKSQNTLTMASSVTAGSTTTVGNIYPKTSVSTKPPRPRALSTGLIAFFVIVLVLSAVGAVFYHNLSEWWVWPHAPQKGDTETETWKQTSSELELQEETEGEGRRFSSETMLYVNHDARTDGGF